MTEPTKETSDKTSGRTTPYWSNEKRRYICTCGSSLLYTAFVTDGKRTTQHLYKCINPTPHSWGHSLLTGKWTENFEMVEG